MIPRRHAGLGAMLLTLAIGLMATSTNHDPNGPIPDRTAQDVATMNTSDDPGEPAILETLPIGHDAPTLVHPGQPVILPAARTYSRRNLRRYVRVYVPEESPGGLERAKLMDVQVQARPNGENTPQARLDC